MHSLQKVRVLSNSSPYTFAIPVFAIHPLGSRRCSKAVLYPLPSDIRTHVRAVVYGAVSVLKQHTIVLASAGSLCRQQREVSVRYALWSEVVVFGVCLKAAFKTQPKSYSDICHSIFEINASLIDFKTQRLEV